MQHRSLLRNLKLMFVTIIFFLCLLVSFPIHSKAEEPSSELAMALIEIDGSDTALEKVAELIVQQHKDVLRTQHPHIKPQALKKYTTYLLEELLSQKTDLLHTIAHLYAQYFTTDDIQQLLEFYESPLGEKLVRAQGDLQEKIVPLTFQWGATAVQRAAARVHDRLREEGIEL